MVETADEVELLANPSLLYSLDVNALNFCRFSLVPQSGPNALVAVPNLVDSNYVCDLYWPNLLIVEHNIIVDRYMGDAIH